MKIMDSQTKRVEFVRFITFTIINYGSDYTVQRKMMQLRKIRKSYFFFG